MVMIWIWEGRGALIRMQPMLRNLVLLLSIYLFQVSVPMCGEITCVLKPALQVLFV